MAREPTLGQLRQKRARYETARARTGAKIDAAAQKMREIDEAMVAARNAGDLATEKRLRRQREAAAGRYRALHESLGQLDREFELPDLGRFTDPCAVESDTPLILLPLRVETRYTADGQHLRVRIYPDTIHIDRLNRSIATKELEAGELYWRSVWSADETGQEQAWARLVGAAGASRAAWIARALRPTNIADRGTGEPAFSDTAPTDPLTIAARLLPDQFVVVARQKGGTARVHGKTIKSPLPMGIFEGPEESLVEVDGVPVAPGAEWIVRYADAVAAGMAVTVKLAEPGGRVESLLVYGIRRSIDGARGAAELGALLEAHDLSRGIGFLPQGTPTNNGEEGRSAWSAKRAATAPILDPATLDPATVEPVANAAVAAEALGINPALLAEVPEAARPEAWRARAMNIALWRATWGNFLDKCDGMGGPQLSDRQRADARTLHRDAVYGRGPLPAIRIGDQPYGLLPVGATDAEWSGAGFEGQMIGLLRRVRTEWRAALRNVSHIVNGETGISETLIELLGAGPISRAVDARGAVTRPTSMLYEEVSGAVDTDAEAELLIGGLAWQALNNASYTNMPISLEEEARPVRLPFALASDAAFCRAILDGGSPGAPKSVFQALVLLGWEQINEKVAAEGGHGRLADLVAATSADTRIRNAFIRSAEQVEAPQPRVFEAQAQTFAAFIDPAASINAYQPIEAARKTYAELAITATSEKTRQIFADLAIFAWSTARAELDDMREALAVLADEAISEDDRRILVGETLDVASHRLDAWITALVERRRRTRRAAKPGATLIGAYGWAEGIAPAGPRESEGYIHAPSIAHAATAGVLRGAYRAHERQAFAIDLTSARVRDAMDLIEGIRQGQSLAALIGYRIERAMHEGNLDAFIFSLRVVAPLVQGRLTDRDEPEVSAQEALAPSNVVDGIRLTEMWKNDRNGVIAAISARPENNPYVTTWAAPIEEEIERLDKYIADAAAALDAVADLLLAESVHQLVKGNSERASAAIDAAATGDSPAPTPDVALTPAGGAIITHKLLIVGGGASWNDARPRAQASPEIEGWAAARLGDPGRIVVHDDAGGRRTLADAGLCALDFVYGAPEPISLHNALRTTLGLAAGTVLAETADPAWPAGSIALGEAAVLAAAMRQLLATATPAAGEDLALVVENLRVTSDATLSATAARAETALAGFGAAIDALANVTADDAAREQGLIALYAYGLAPPMGGQRADVAALALAAARQRHERAAAALAGETTRESLVEAGRAIFGDGFWILAPLDPAADTPEVWDSALETPPAGATVSAVRRWLADVGSVRDGVARYNEVLLLAEALGISTRPRIAQIAALGEKMPESWVAEPLPTPPDGAVTSWLIDAAADYGPGKPTVALVVDHFTENLPEPPHRIKPEDPEKPPRHVSGIAMHARAASARPPQALLLPVPPDTKPWSSARIEAVLDDAIELAKLRTVRLEHTAVAGQILPAIYTQSWSLQGEKVLDYRELLTDAAAISVMPYLGRQTV
jgi:hypothetical protein